MLAGIAMYVIYRLSQGKSVTKRVTLPEKSLMQRLRDALIGAG